MIDACAIVPIKRLAEAKGRLSEALAPDERQLLTLWMAQRVLCSLRSAGLSRNVYVLTPDPVVATLARKLQLQVLPDRGGGLNVALEVARREVMTREVRTCLVVFADLPLLTSEDVTSIFDLAGDGPHAVVAPDRHGVGTNVLLLRPPDALPYTFGASSYSAYLDASSSAGLHLSVYRSTGTSLDVDTLADLEELRAHGVEPPDITSSGVALDGHCLVESHDALSLGDQLEVRCG